MKNLSRLTALLLALMMLFTSMPAFATESEAIPVDEFEAADYASLLSIAEEDAAATADASWGNIFDGMPCAKDNVYCQNVLHMLECPNAQKRYEYLNSLYSEVGVDLEFTMLHYYFYHVEDQENMTDSVVCTCSFPFEEPEYVIPAPGDISKHDESCPWHFANLSLAEQYDVIRDMDANTQATYKETLSADALETLNRVNVDEYATGNVAISVPNGAFAEDYLLDVEGVTASEAIQNAILEAIGEDVTITPIDAYDITFGNLTSGAEMQPKEEYPVSLKFTVPTSELTADENGALPYLSIFHIIDNGDGTYTAESVGQGMDVNSEIENQEITVEADAFSIYVSVGSDSTDWNVQNWDIYMTVGDSLPVSTTRSGNSYRWSIISGDTNSFTLSNTTRQEATIRANSTGTVKLQCVITTNYGDTITEEMDVYAVPSVGSSIDDDIIFKRITAAHTSNDSTSITEYGNTYGPYVMKIRFEDTNGDLLDMGEDYYVFDTDVPININTFAADAPSGYTYDGAFFYWSGHYSGTKSYVSEVQRTSTLGNANSYLYFDYIVSGESAVNKDVYYQPSGVLHIVYRKTSEAYSIVFEDHDDHVLHSYTIPKKDSGTKVPAAYVTTLKDTLLLGIENNHDSLGVEWEFTGSWVVTGGSSSINGTYTTDQLVTNVPRWALTSNITVTAVCRQKATINYVVVGPDNCGQVTPSSETIYVDTQSPSGSTASANDGYTFKGWYSDAACENLITTAQKYVPNEKVAATYYALFEENEVTINYIGVDPDGNLIDTAEEEATIGSVSLDTETVKVISETPAGSTATAASPTYKFVGWYLNEACTQAVPAAWVSGNKITPQKNADGLYEGKTYYAKFDWNVADLTITKTVVTATGSTEDANLANREFTFNVTLSDIAAHTYTVYNADNTQASTGSITGGSGTIKLKNGQRAVINTVVINSTYTVTETDLPTGYVNTAKTGDEGSISPSGSTATFTNTYYTTNLSITKNVVGTDAPADASFEFTVSLPDGTYSYTVGGEPKTLTVSGGRGTLSLKNDQTAEISGIAVGATYTVAEDDYSASYTTTTTGNLTGELLSEGATVTFTNTYKYDSLTIEKMVENKTDVAATTNEFKFTINLADASDAPITGRFNYSVNGTDAAEPLAFTDGTATLTLKGGDVVLIKGLLIGTKYTVTETIPTGFESSTIPVTGTIADGENKVTVTNTFKVGDLNITKTIEGDDDNTGDDVFTFTVTVGDALYNGAYKIGETEYPAANGIITITGEGTAVIENIPINTAYTVAETAMPAGYEMTASNGTRGNIAKDGSLASFTNTYSTGSLKITKTVVGTDAPTGDNADTFTFTVLLENCQPGTYGAYTFTKVEGTNNATATVTIKGSNAVTIDGIPNGVKYTVTEAAHDKYTLSGNNNLSDTIVKDTVKDAAFTNTYKYASLTIEKRGILPIDHHEKYGTNEKESQSTIFTVDGIDVTVVINGNGSVTIKNVPLGTYTVTEDETWSWRYSADDASKEVTVTADGANTVTFNNSRDEIYWLSGDCYAENNFGAFGTATN